MFGTQHSLQGRIERLIGHAQQAVDDELQAELARYLCILVSSLVEERCRERASTFTNVRSAPEVARFVRAQMKRLRSPSSGNIRDFFSGFDPTRANDWYEGLADDQRDALDSIAANRNQLAHGTKCRTVVGSVDSLHGVRSGGDEGIGSAIRLSSSTWAMAAEATTQEAGTMTRRCGSQPVLTVAAAVGIALAGAAQAAGQDGPGPHDAAEFDMLFEEVKNWGRWGADDELGTANLVTDEKRRQALALATTGRTVSLSHNPMPDEAPDNPDSAFNHTMAESLRADTIEFSYHGYGVSHIDALCHFLHNGAMYNGVPPDASSVEGGLRQARHPESEAGDRDARRAARHPAAQGGRLPGAGDRDLHGGDRDMARAGRGHDAAGRRGLPAHRPLGAPRRAGAMAAIGRLGRHSRFGHSLDSRAGTSRSSAATRRPTCSRRGSRGFACPCTRC